jgi:hypothetical protein
VRSAAQSPPSRGWQGPCRTGREERREWEKGEGEVKEEIERERASKQKKPWLRSQL